MAKVVKTIGYGNIRRFLRVGFEKGRKIVIFAY